MKKFLIVVAYFSLISVLMSQTKQYCRFEYNGKIQYGIVIGEKVHGLKEAPWLSNDESGVAVNLDEVRLFYPSEPNVIIGLSKSYKTSWENKTPPKFVRWFIKPSTSAAGDGEEVVLPALVDEAKVECELVIVIGKTVKNADMEEASKAIFGFTLGNDIVGSTDSFHKLQGEPLDMKEGVLGPGLKVGDKFEPFGPFIYTGIDWRDHGWTIKIDNESTNKHIEYDGNTNELLYPPALIVSQMSEMMTLKPGDIISTGTAKSFLVSNGDIVTLEMDGIGKLINKIVK